MNLLSLIPQKRGGKRKKHMYVKKCTAENKTKQDKIAINTVFSGERNDVIFKESFHQKLRKTV